MAKLNVDPRARWVMKLRSGRALVIPGARHELLQERDHFREQLLAAFLAFVTGSTSEEALRQHLANSENDLLRILEDLINVLIVDEPQYRPLEDFTAIAELASLPNFVLAGPAVNSLQDLIAQAKQRPGQLNFASGGVGSQSHIAGELFKLAAGINPVHVPFRALGDAVTELVAQRVHYYVIPISAGLPLLKEGRLKALAVTVDKRLEQLPEVPTTAEAGLPGFRIDGWFGVVGRAGMPRALVNRLNADIVEALKQPDTRERFVRMGSEPVYTTPASFEKMMNDEFVRYRDVIKAAGIRAQ